MKTGLVMEGGAMRGLYSAGVTDVLMENGAAFDGAIGVSAGAVFGCNVKSGQIGRVIRYNKRFCRNWRYVSLRSLLLTGDLYGVDFAYHQLPEVLDPFDTAAYQASPMAFYVVCTDCETGEPVYYRCDRGDERDIRIMQASASMPLAARIVDVDGRKLSDGGTADSIPVAYFQALGYDRCVVVLTQPEGYVKQPNAFLPLIRARLKRYPALIRALETRHDRYNATLAYLREEEAAGRILVLRPPQALHIGVRERDPNEMERVYQIGRSVAEARLDDIRSFLRGDSSCGENA